MQLSAAWVPLALATLLFTACDETSGLDVGTIEGPDAGGPQDAQPPADSGPSPDATADAGTTQDGAVPDAGSACDGRTPGVRFPSDGECNFCECDVSGNLTCSNRTCVPSDNGCEYDGASHAYGARFPAADDCNECVCAASGLACTRRNCPGSPEEGAILLESMDAPCGPDNAFTPRLVLDGLPTLDGVPFLYERVRKLYPESLPDTTISLRFAYDGGYLVCRIPAEGQEAIDIEIFLEWITADGAFDEGFHTYLRRNASGFVVNRNTVGTLPAGRLNGTYDPNCLDPNGFSFVAVIEDDGLVNGGINKVCETDITLGVGSFERLP